MQLSDKDITSLGNPSRKGGVPDVGPDCPDVPDALRSADNIRPGLWVEWHGLGSDCAPRMFIASAPYMHPRGHMVMDVVTCPDDYTDAQLAEGDVPTAPTSLADNGVIPYANGNIAGFWNQWNHLTVSARQSSHKTA